MNDILSIEEIGNIDSSTYSGTTQGYQLRKSLSLDDKDKDNNSYTLVFPSNTTTVTPNYIAGLFSDSKKVLQNSIEFKKKYHIDVQKINPRIRGAIGRRINDEIDDLFEK